MNRDFGAEAQKAAEAHLNPLQVAEHSGRVVVLQGQHRLQEARALGHSHVPVTDDNVHEGWEGFHRVPEHLKGHRG